MHRFRFTRPKRRKAMRQGAVRPSPPERRLAESLAGSPDQTASEREQLYAQLGGTGGPFEAIFADVDLYTLRGLVEQYAYGLEHGYLKRIRYVPYVAKILAAGDAPWFDWWPGARAMRQSSTSAPTEPARPFVVQRAIDRAIEKYGAICWHDPPYIARVVQGWADGAEAMGRPIVKTERDQARLDALARAPSPAPSAVSMALGLRPPAPRSEEVQRQLEALRERLRRHRPDNPCR